VREAIYRHVIEACGDDASTVTFFADVLRSQGNGFHLSERIAAVVYVGWGDANTEPVVEVIGRQPLANQDDEVRMCDYFEWEAARLVELSNLE
jgi:hypothetical protein